MIDAEVVRLRRLRDVALGARSVARAIQMRAPSSHGICDRGAVLCWRLASVASGRLQAHPYRRFQRGPSLLRTVVQEIGASIGAAVAHRRGKTTHRLLIQLQRVARELDDARTLTWSADLSDALGRAQIHLRDLLHRIEIQARQEAGSTSDIQAPGARELRAESRRAAHDSGLYLTI